MMTSLPANRARLPAARLIVILLLTIFIFSIPAKWATVHISGALIVLALLLSDRSYWSAQPTQDYARYTLLWLVPVLGASFAQQLLHLDTATPWEEQLTLTLRVLGVGLGLLLMLHKGWVSVRQLGFLVMGCLLVHGVIGITQWAINPSASLAAWRAIRVEGIVGNANPFGFYMALGVVLCAACLRGASPSRAARLALWACAAIFALGILGSGSRGAIITASAGMAVLFPPSSPRRIGLYVAVLGSLLLAYLSSDWQVANAHSDGSRTQALMFSLDAISQRPLTGWGMESFMRIPGHTGINSPHNMLADLALSSGIISLAAFLLALGLVIYRLFLLRTSLSTTVLALLATTFVAGTLEYSVLSSNHFRAPWVLIVALACHAIGTSHARDRRADTAANEIQGAFTS
ncbi:O-antigen ligase family protein [Thauera sp.]|jgi:O-antigen ligase|uniref:O-antigen ligase family protein n=1 Tax=Thauera sp. TaxID=1905334 RepID=UPI002A36F8EE|nr:O-antigen ligase family protein [Thauera sp.]MDX9887464.1 O-antigen ligase family protein [Thauera sp.]